MNIHLIVKQHEGGFFSNFNKVITFLAHNDNVCKITWDLQGQPFGAFAYNCGEVFSKLFLPYDSGEVIDKTIILSEFTDSFLNSGQAIHSRFTDSDQSWRIKYNNAFIKYIHYSEKLKQKIDKIDFKSNNTLIGILKRNQLTKADQINKVLPTYDDYFNVIDNIDGDKTIVLSIDHNYGIQQFINRYKNCVFSSKIRRTNMDTDMEPHFIQSTEEEAMYYFLDVVILSKCDYIIHTISNMSVAALIMNHTIISKYIYAI
jgi:hypothetical protein